MSGCYMRKGSYHKSIAVMSSSFNNKKSNNNRRILVVDDEPDLILVFRTVLKEEGFEVDSFTDPN